MRDLFEKLLDGSHISEGEARRLVDELVDPDAEPLLAGAVLTALRAQGETADELRGFALRLRELAMMPPFEPDLAAVDVVGTGATGRGASLSPPARRWSPSIGLFPERQRRRAGGTGDRDPPGR